VGVELVDPGSGTRFQLLQARMPQTCQACRDRVLPGDWITNAGGGGWTHLRHLETQLACAALAPLGEAWRQSRALLAGKEPGDAVEVTAALLALAGAGR
jgi:hypothetical protein